MEKAVVPISPTVIELDRLRPTLELMADVAPLNDVEIHILTTRVRRGTRSARDIRNVLVHMNLPVMETEIPLLEVFAGSFDDLPFDTRGYGAALAELIGPIQDGQ